jgi:peptidoglycan DL-endopeptidase CwlO
MAALRAASTRDRPGKSFVRGLVRRRTPLLPSLVLFRHTRNFFLVAAACSLVVGTLASAVTVAGADPISDKEAQAKQLQDDIETTSQQLSELGEKYNGAVLVLQQRQADLDAIQAQINATQAKVDATQALVDERSASVYRRALRGQSLDSIDYSDAQHLLVRKHYASAQAQQDDDLLRQLADEKAKLAEQRAAAEKARAEADAQRQQLADMKTALEETSAKQHDLLTQVQGELAQLVAQEMARRQAEAAAMAQARLAGGEGDPNLPPPGPAAAQALAYAEAQMGKTYVYAASGPDHFDCSGLTMAAYRSAGVSLPHYSGAQYAALPHVPLDHVMPGDLIFWGTAASVHVALYYGNARILESGGSSNDVHIGPIWGHPMGAARVLQ